MEESMIIKDIEIQREITRLKLEKVDFQATLKRLLQFFQLFYQLKENHSTIRQVMCIKIIALSCLILEHDRKGEQIRKAQLQNYPTSEDIDGVSID
jgi:hypothetical protein